MCYSSFYFFIFFFSKDALQAQIVIKKMNEMMDTSSSKDAAKDNVDNSDPVPEIENKVVEVSWFNPKFAIYELNFKINVFFCEMTLTSHILKTNILFYCHA